MTDLVLAMIAASSYLAVASAFGIVSALDECVPEDERQASQWAGIIARMSLLWPVMLPFWLAQVLGEKYTTLLTRIILRPIRHRLKAEWLASEIRQAEEAREREEKEMEL